MIQLISELAAQELSGLDACFNEQAIEVKHVNLSQLEQLDLTQTIISLSKFASLELQQRGIAFYNWDLLFAILGPNDKPSDNIEVLKEKLNQRIEVLKAVEGVQSPVSERETHISIRVHDLACSAAFYSWLYGVKPKEWTHRYVTILNPATNVNLVLLVADDKTLHQDTLYHLGVGVATKDDVVAYYHSGVAQGFKIEKPPRTTWRGTPLHELWLQDPDGTLIEVYARLTATELAQMPADKEPLDLV